MVGNGLIGLLRTTLHRIRSERGASLSMALMLMLVCVMVASVAITAGSAAAGRLSQVQKMSNSYYNVTSAAKLFAGELDGTQVVIERAYNASEYSSKGLDDSIWFSLKIGNKTISESSGLSSSNSTLFEILTCDLLFETQKSLWTENRAVSKTAISNSMTAGSDRPEPRELSFRSYDGYPNIDVTPSNDLENSFKTVEVSVTRKDDETFAFTFSEKLDSEDTEANKLPSTEYTVFATAQITRNEFDESDTSHPVWVTFVEWDYLYTVSGGA